MGVIDRVSQTIARGEIALRARDLETEARRLLHTEAPWMEAESVSLVVNNFIGFGPIQPLLDDPDVTDVLINGALEVWVDRGDSLELTDYRFGTDEDLVSAVERVIAPLGLRIDRSAPTVSARLHDGSRLHAVLPPASVDHPLVAIRRFTQRVQTLEALVDAGTATESQVEQLVQAVADRRTIVIAGGTGVGKTTLINLLAGQIDENERVVTIEDAAELALPGHTARLEARPPNSEGTGEITIRTLLRSALRLRPDRIIVGEVRGPEALDLISALNTGHRGSMTTVHANSPLEAMWRLETLSMTAGSAPLEAIRRQLWAAVDLVVQLERSKEGRVIAEIVPVDELVPDSWN